MLAVDSVVDLNAISGRCCLPIHPLRMLSVMHQNQIGIKSEDTETNIIIPV